MMQITNDVFGANYIINGDILNIILKNGQPHTIRKTHANYDKLFELVTTGVELSLSEWSDLLNPAINQSKEISEYNPSANLEIKGGYIFYKGLEIDNYLASKILKFKESGLPYEPMFLFLEKLLKNPSRQGFNFLYPFLEHHGMAITKEGNFLGYKGVNNDYSSIHVSVPRIVSKPGTSPEIPRWMVDDNSGQSCSTGLHVGTYEYAKDWARGASIRPGKVVLVEVDPADAVTVPSNEVNKLRCCRYTVLKDVEDVIHEEYYDSDDYDDDYEDNYDDISDSDVDDYINDNWN